MDVVDVGTFFLIPCRLPDDTLNDRVQLKIELAHNPLLVYVELAEDIKLELAINFRCFSF